MFRHETGTPKTMRGGVRQHVALIIAIGHLACCLFDVVYVFVYFILPYVYHDKMALISKS